MSGVALSVAALVLVVAPAALWFRRAQAVRLPENRWPFVACWIGGAALGIVALVQGSGWLAGTPAVLAVVAGLFLTTLVAISRQEAAADAITVGAALPDFSCLDENGERFALSSTLGKPLLLKFYRGHW